MQKHIFSFPQQCLSLLLYLDENNQGARNMTSQSNPKHLRFTAALTPKSLSRICATLVVCLVATGFGTANADIIADRKAGFKRNADSMKAIAAAIESGDYQTVISRADGIASWASKIPSYFPEGSDSGDTKARAEIWFEFDAFKAKAKANETAARTLVTAAKSGDQGAMMAGLKNLGASCKSCHSDFKE
jgi:cytochrome c556